MYAGSLRYDTKLDTAGFQKGVNKLTGTAKSGGATIKSIVAGLGITKIIEKGIGAITNSVDDAIKRFDTLNNFPKVMESLGIESKSAEKAINKLSDRLTGLPTTLDSATSSVARFVSKNGDIDKSTDIFLALNNAIIAGGSSMQVQTAALEQVTQAYSRGKFEMEEWKSLLVAAPGQVKQVASSFKMSTDTLYDSLKHGDITMEQFMNRVVELNTKGGKGFASFEEQAKNAVGGIETSITNMRTAITRGTTKIIESLDKGLKKAKLGGLSTQISSLGKKVENALKDIAKALERVNWQKTIKLLKELAKVIGVVVAQMIAYKTTLMVLKGINIVKNVLGTVTAFVSLAKEVGSVTKAMGVLNIVMKANPVGLVITALTGLIAAMVLFSSKAKETNSTIAQTNNTLKEYKTSMDDAQNSKKQYLQENGSEIAYYQSLYAELQGLVDANGRIQKGYEARAKFIASTLNEALGTEINIVGNVIQNYNKLKTSVEDVIRAKRAQMLVEANEKTYNEAKNQKIKLEKQYANQLKETNNAQKEYDKSLKELSVSAGLSNEELKKYQTTAGGLRVNDIPGLNNAQIQLANTLDTTGRNLKTSKETLNSIGKEYSNNQLIIGNYENALYNLQNKNYNAVLKIYEDTINYGGKTSQETYNNYQNQINMQKQYLDDLKNNKYNYDKDYVDSEIKKTESVIKNLESEQAKYKQKVSFSQKTIKGIWNQGMTDLLQDITGKKVQFRETANGQIQMYINGIKQGKPMSKKQAKDVTQGIIDELKRGKKNGKIAGKDLVNGVDEGIEYKKGSVFTTVKRFGQDMLAKLKASLKEHSPSKATREMGVNLVKGLGLGISDKQKALYNQVDKLGKTTLKRMYKSLNSKGSLNDVKKVSFWSTIVKNTKKGTTAYTQALSKLNSARKNLKNDVTKTTKTFASELKSIDNEIKERKNSILNSLNLFDKFKANKSNSKQVLKENLKSQVNALKNWNNVLTSLKKKIKNKNLYEFLEDQDISSLKTLQEINSMSTKELREYESLYAQKEKLADKKARAEYSRKIESAKKTYINSLKKLGIDGSKASRKVGNQIALGINAGFTSGMKGTTASLKRQLKKMLNSAKKQLKIHSPSRVYRDDIGRQISAGIGVGVEVNTKSAIEAIRKLNDEMYNEMKKSVVVSTGAVKSDATINSNYGFNNKFTLNAEFKGNVDLDGKKVGQIVTPTVAKTLKTGGVL